MPTSARTAWTLRACTRLPPNTTPESLELHRLFRKMLDANVHHVVLEVSSQALRHNRVDGIPFEVVAFTNLSEDHIGPGEHPGFRGLQKREASSVCGLQAREMIYNADDDTSEFMRIGFGGHQTSYGIERAADYHGSMAQFRSETALGIDFVRAWRQFHRRAGALPRRVQRSDALCAIALCGAFGVTPAQAAQTLAHTPVQGRFEVVEGLPGRTFIVDYSHNGLALTSALKTLRAYNPHKLLCVFGSVGGRTRCAAGSWPRPPVRLRITASSPATTRTLSRRRMLLKNCLPHAGGRPLHLHHRPPRGDPCPPSGWPRMGTSSCLPAKATRITS